MEPAAGAEKLSIVWTIIIGFIGGIAKNVAPSENKRGGFVLTTILGIAGAFVDVAWPDVRLV
jgi:uncharacterized membrane protein YeaQ/YmgE (transglycosylase-associated protein family)